MSQQRVSTQHSVPPITGVLGILSNLDKLPPEYKIEVRAGGAVIITHSTPPNSANPGGTVSEFRVDSRMDKDIVSKGETLWYSKFLPKVSK